MTAAELAEQLELMTYGVGAQTPDGTFPLPDKMPTFAPAALLRQAAARLRSMEEALKPFAISPERDNASLHDDWQVARNPEITMGDLRRACAALQGDGQ